MRWLKRQKPSAPTLEDVLAAALVIAHDWPTLATALRAVDASGRTFERGNEWAEALVVEIDRVHGAERFACR